MIRDSITIMEEACQELDAIPYKDFGYAPSILLETAASFHRIGKTMETQILNCIHGYLGILYLHRAETGAFAERNRYLFCHHQFRDYFSAMWDVQMLSLLPCLPVQPSSVLFQSDGHDRAIGRYINRSFWSRPKTELISQILMEHRNRPVIDLLYSGRFCYTLDAAGCVKCWDVLSGKMEFELDSVDPCGLYDYSPGGSFKLSPDKKWLAVKIQDPTPKGIEVGVDLIALTPQGYVSARYPITMDAGEHRTLDAIFFTGDSNAILLLCDKMDIYCYQLDGTALLYHQKHSVLVEGTILYTPDAQSPLIAFTGDYDPMEWKDWYTETYLEDEDSGEIDDNAGAETSSAITCHIYEVSHTSDDSKEIYRFTGMGGTAPTISYIPDLGGFLFFNYSTMQIGYLDCSDGNVTEMFSDIVDANDGPPSHFHPHATHYGECYIMYPDTCYLIDLEHPDSSGIIMTYTIHGVANLLPEGSTADGLYFKTGIAPVNGRFIVANDVLVYEWDSENDLLLPKYNVAYYEVTDLICDARHDRFILVHQNNGLSIFGGNEIKLKNAITFHEEGYNLTMSCFEPEKCILALTFSRPDHEKILLFDLVSGEQRYCFSTQHPNESILSCCFNKTGTFLLIVTQYACHEYELSKKRLWNILTASAGERCIGGDHTDDGIEIVIVPHRREDEKKTVSRCVCYKRRPYRDTIYYRSQGYYLLPELSEELYQAFVIQSYDYGVEGTVDENGIQDFWVTRGFFFPSDDDTLRFEAPTLQYFDADGRPKQQEHKVAPFQMVYFRHTHVLRQRYRQYETGTYIDHAYLDEESGQAVFIENQQNLFYCPDYKRTSYQEIWDAYKKKIGSYNGDAYWSFIAPWHGDRLICCYENFQLAVLDAKTGDELELIDYTPGMAIFGCDLRKAVLDEGLKKELQRNGGRV